MTSNEEAARLSNELSDLRSRALQENAQESMMRERELRETQMELERCRMERDEWERVALQERVAADEAESVKREIERERELSERLQAELALEKENEANLQSVLQDFQAGAFARSDIRTSLILDYSERSRAQAGCQGLRDAASASNTITRRVQAPSFDC